MRGSVVGAAVMAVIFGWIIADLWSHPKATNSVGNTLVTLEKNTGNQVSGA